MAVSQQCEQTDQSCGVGEIVAVHGSRECAARCTHESQAELCECECTYDPCKTTAVPQYHTDITDRNRFDIYIYRTFSDLS